MFARVARAKMAGPALSRLRQIADTGAHKEGRFSDAFVHQTLLVTIALCFIAKIVHRAESKALVRQMVAVASAIFTLLAMIALVARHTISAMIVLPIAKMLSRVEGTARAQQGFLALVAIAIFIISAMIAQCARQIVRHRR